MNSLFHPTTRPIDRGLLFRKVDIIVVSHHFLLHSDHQVKGPILLYLNLNLNLNLSLSLSLTLYHHL